MRRGIRSVFLFIFLLLVGESSLLLGDSPEIREQIHRRAQEIAPFLSSSPSQLIPPITERAVWDRAAATPEGEETIARAQQLMSEPIIPLPEEVYKEFYTTGNRSHAEGIFAQRKERWMTLARAELYENKGCFLPALEEALRDYCAYPSWAHPAHDKGGMVYDGKMELPSLYANKTGASLAIVRQAMVTVLSPDLSEQIAENIERRILTPYVETVEETREQGVWWVTSHNNWNPVCTCGTVLCALSLFDDPQKKAFFVAAAEYHLSHDYMENFPEDGYCAEGIGYWNYGFSSYCAAAETVYRETRGASNLYAAANIRNVTLYALRMEVVPGVFPTISDCELGISPSKRLVGLLSARLGLGLKEYEKEAIFPDYEFIPPFMFHPEEISPAIEPNPYRGDESLRSVFSKVLICRPPQAGERPDPAQICAVFKGGNNAEPHNHNDLGSFSLLLGKNWLVSDPGRERYTARTFSESRYEGELLSSIGHSVPRIAGVTQSWGGRMIAETVEETFSEEKDSWTLNITSAYTVNPESFVDGLLKVWRRFDYERSPVGEPNKVTVTDTFQFLAGMGNTFESPLITFANWEVLRRADDLSEYTLRLQKEEDAVEVLIRATGDGKPLPLELNVSIVAEHDLSADNKPTRLAFASKERAENGVIEMIFVPAK